MIITGYHGIEELLQSPKGKMQLNYSKDSKRNNEMLKLAEKAGVPVSKVSPKEMDALCQNKNHRGICLKTDQKKISNRITFEEFLAGDLSESSVVLFLDGITDPHNFGAILRSCDQFEVDLVVLPAKRSVRETDVVVRTSAGASAYVPHVSVPNLRRSLQQAKEAGYWIYGADMDGTASPQVNLKGKVALVMGSEGKGLHRIIHEECDQIISIPSGGHIDSLNVSVATGILLYEVSRQQKRFY